MYIREIASWVDDLSLEYLRGEQDDERMDEGCCVQADEVEVVEMANPMHDQALGS